MTNQVDRIMGELERHVEKVAIRLTLNIAAQLIPGTPVDTGWARANWIPQVRTPYRQLVGDPESIDTGKQQEGSVSVLQFKLKADLKLYISNNVPYIRRLNDGHSKQAPIGFIQRATALGLATPIFISSP